MKIVRRDSYIDKLHRLADVPDIKVITGVRRSGKSMLMRCFAEELSQKHSDINIIYIDLTCLEAEHLKEYHKLNEYIEEKYQATKRNFVFIDEVQLCPNFELTVNSLHASGKYSIYISGSNAFLLSSDLATLFTGRTFSIEVYPFSFAEYVRYFGSQLPYRALDDYIRDGGMAGAYPYPDEEERSKYVTEVYDTLILRDIKQKYRIRNLPALEKISDYMMDNISNLTTARNISDTMAASGNAIHHTTVAAYIDCLCKAFAFYKIRRYDIRGKRWLVASDKYYLSDHAFRHAKLGRKNPDRGRILENIVAIELLRRGYTLYTGMLYKKEIDFVAIKRDETIYIQAADSIDDSNTLKREVTPLLQIRNGYQKMLIARTWQPEYLYEGIKIIDAADFLLGKTERL